MQLSLFIPYLWYVNIQEIALDVLYKNGIISSSGVYYNIYRPLAVTCFFFIFYRLEITNALIRKFMLRMYVIYMTFAIITFILTTALKSFNSYLALATGFMICCFALSFLINYFNLDDPAEEKRWFPVVLITVGILAFYPVINISFAFYKHLLAAKTLVWGTKLYQSIPQIMSIFMYSCFTYAFYLCRKKP